MDTAFEAIENRLECSWHIRILNHFYLRLCISKISSKHEEVWLVHIDLGPCQSVAMLLLTNTKFEMPALPPGLVMRKAPNKFWIGF